MSNYRDFGKPSLWVRVLGGFLIGLASLGLCALPAHGQVNVTGQWQTLPTLMPINPVHAALMHNGKVLIVSGSGNLPSNANYLAAIWDPQTDTVTTQPLPFDLFCNGMIVLPDGRPFIMGGTLQFSPPYFQGASQTAAYDPTTGNFVELQSMAHGRWYPTATTLRDGSIMVFSGTNEIGDTNLNVEFYKVGSGWSQPYGAPFTPPLYPRMHLLPNGTVFNSGSQTSSALFNPATQTWTTGVALTNYSGTRTYGTSVLLPLTPANNYDPRVMIMGGGNPATATTEIIDLGASSPAWVYGPSMSKPRIEMDAVILPSGKILAVNGSTNDEDKSTASLNADLYDPKTNTFSSAGVATYPRLYHSGALLLPNATVLILGGNPERGNYEPHLEIYTPAYLFNSDGSPATQPTITGVTPGVIGYGGGFQIQTPNAANISSVVLVRAGSPTHAFDMDQRLVALNFSVGSGVLNATAPPNSSIAPPGYYMLFVLNSAGVPSVGEFVQLSLEPADQPPTGTITSPAGNVMINPGQSVSFAGTGTSASSTIAAYSWMFPGGNPASSSLANPGSVTYPASAPVITSENPTSGPVGTMVTITAAPTNTYVASLTVTDSLAVTDPSPPTRTIAMPGGFGSSQGTSTVTFNGVAATPTSWTATSITVPVPSGAQSGSIVVTVGGVASNGVGFTVTTSTPPPSITSLNPTSGPVGTGVTITGTYFGSTQGNSTVTFNGTAATVTSWSTTSIVTSVPTGATSGNVVVTVGGVASNTIPFTVTTSVSPPSITSLRPITGPVGTAVTITGTNFGSSGTVTFNGTTATTTSWSATSIATSVPAGATSGNVVVTVGGVASNGVAFTVTTSAPTITSLSTNSGPVGTAVTITGMNFGSTGTVTFNGTMATTTSWSATSIATSVPAGATSGNVVVTVGGVASNGVSFTVTTSGSPTINYGSGFTAGGMNLLGSAKLNGTALRLTDGNSNEAAAAWYGTQVNIQNFTTDFTFLISGGTSTADGFTFTIQGANSSALGNPGGSLGYGPNTSGAGGIPTSVAVKFDLYSNSGEGADSTGLYTNGASPTTPAVDMSGSGVNLHSGDPFHVHMSYDGTNLVMTITDTTTSGSFSNTWPINIPTTVGGNVAYVGFTGGTGGLAATQDIQTWTFTSVSTSAPTITSLSPTSGAVGTQVTITGTNFGSSGTVTFNGTTATTTSWSATSIVTSVPAGATSGNVVVTVGGVASNGVAFTVTTSAPTITSLSTNSGPAGTAVTITGMNFGSSGTVTFNGTAATTTSWSATSIATSVPAGATSGNVVVTVGGVASNGVAFTVTTSAPTITSLSTNSGPVGTAVTITGTNFGSSGTVTFNGTTATTTSWSATSIATSVPAGATSGNVIVTVGGVASNGVAFTVTTSAPTITSLSTNSGPVGTAVTITGMNFGSTGTVTFNGTMATTTSWSATSIATSVPAGATSGNVVVTVGGVASNGVSFTVTTSGSPTINYGSGFTAGGMNLLGSAKLNGTALRLTDGNSNEAAAAWYGTQVNIQNFTTDFTFLISGGTSTADGFTFTIQGANSSALGNPGGSLGYGPNTSGAGGIPTSVAVKFDLYSNSGEGADSTGLYTNGASPTTPAVDMSGSGVNLHSGDPFHVHMSYDGTNLVMTITDTTTSGSFSNTWPINIPTTVGGNVAYVGFTGGTGGLAATQDIQTWTFTSVSTSAPTITSLSPTSGAVGTQVTITGTNFGSSGTVTFNGTTATTTSWSATSIVTSVPAGATSGNVVVTVGGVATNGVAFTVGQAPAITSANSTTFTVGAAGTFTVTTTGSPTPALTESGALPSPVTFKDNGNGTATLSGTPAAGTGGTYSITITANNGVGTAASQTFTLTVNQAPVITSANSTTFTVGAAGTFTVTTTGKPTPALIESGTLPSLVTFKDNGNGTATLSGTPAAGTNGTYPITITANNGVGTAATQTFTLTVNSGSTPPTITSANSTTFTVGAAGTFTVTTTGSPTPALTESGALPSPVTFKDNGNGTATLSGTPAAGTGGTYSITITANNGVGTAASQTFTLTVNQAPVITSANSTTFTVGAAGTFTVTTTGKPTPALTESGALPTPVTFKDNGNGTATIAGTPATGTAGSYPITITASNGVGTPATQSFTLTVTSGGGGGIKLVQHISVDAGTTSSASLPFPANNTLGNWIGVCIRAGQPNETFTVQDSKGNIYHQATQINQTGDGDTLAIFYAENIAAGANTITVRDSNADTLRFAILEYSGVATSGSLDKATASQGSNASPNSGGVTTTTNGDLLLGAIMTADPETFTAGSGFQIVEGVPAAPNTKLIVEYQIQALSGATSSSAALSSADPWAAAIAAFKP